MPTATEREGRVRVSGGTVWFKIVGTGVGIPLLTLHGGPSGGHDYLEPFQEIGSERPVIFYDQLGCGKSDRPDNPSLWRIERFVDEIHSLRKELRLDRVHLLGHSWGGWLAIEYMMGKPTGIISMILASASSSLHQVAEETARLKATLPQEVLDTLSRYEATSDYHNPEYEKAMMEFYNRFLCRLSPWPDCLMRTLNNLNNSPVPYQTMQGPNEFTITGNLKDWDRTGQLGDIPVPTLITCGRYDELGPPCAETLHRGIPNSQLHIFENSAHTAHLEETHRYLKVLRAFLSHVEASV